MATLSASAVAASRRRAEAAAQPQGLETMRVAMLLGMAGYCGSVRRAHRSEPWA